MAFAAAREGQSRLNGEFGRTRYANTMLLTEIERDIESLDAAGLAGEVDDAEAAARAALAAGDSQAAADAFAEARMLQLEVNREYARSRFVSSARVEALEVERQSAASLPLVTNLSEADDAISFLLVRRETAKAAERIVLANAQVGELFELLPKSRHLDADLRLKLTYLNSQRERLREIQDAVYDRVRPLPGASELRMLQTEFPQALFQQVMKTNPSRNPGRAYPVDSVSWFDATECCRRLSWILGLPVRLPTADEFRVAVGDAAEHTVPEDQHARTDRSREMAARSANAAGFFDLLGNLAEWLDAPESQLGGAPAIVAGGSYLDGVETLRTVPLAELARAERGRHIGFRVVLATER
jgi:multidrug efflux pump subunit AcrA (membrane-fusion protein)